jgi:hypothetical protein
LKENHSYDDDFTEEAAPIIKKYFKSFGSERTAFAEEVFKLCLDLNVPLAYGKLLRDKVMSWR